MLHGDILDVENARGKIPKSILKKGDHEGGSHDSPGQPTSIGFVTGVLSSKSHRTC